MPPSWIAITRPVSPTLAGCELTHRAREPIDVERACEQHRAYEQVLAGLGARIVRAPAAPDAPDAVFVEDTAIVLDEVAIVTRPGAASRRAETDGIARLLAGFRNLHAMTPPATLDGGDVLVLGRTLFVGRSSRTNDDGIVQLAAMVTRFGYRVVPVEVEGCLHLKSAATALTDHLLLVNPQWVPVTAFPGIEVEPVDPAEPDAANALRVGPTVVFPEHFPRTAARIGARGLKLAPVACDELAKAEGGVTCCSLLFADRGPVRSPDPGP